MAEFSKNADFSKIADFSIKLLVEFDIKNPIKYNDLNPKYIELYSNKPPNMASRIFEDRF